MRADSATEIVAVPVPQAARREPTLFDIDEHPRPDTKMECSRKLPAAFKKGGTVTAGNSSGVNDGAAAVLVMSEEKARELGLKPKARYVASAAAGVNPLFMGLGPIPATRKLLERTRLSVDQIDLIELNEAFRIPVARVYRRAWRCRWIASTSTAAPSRSATPSAAPARS